MCLFLFEKNRAMEENTGKKSCKEVSYRTYLHLREPFSPLFDAHSAKLTMDIYSPNPFFLTSNSPPPKFTSERAHFFIRAIRKLTHRVGKLNNRSIGSKNYLETTQSTKPLFEGEMNRSMLSSIIIRVLLFWFFGFL